MMSEMVVTSIRVNRELIDKLDGMVEVSSYESRTDYLTSMIRQHTQDDVALNPSDRERTEHSLNMIRMGIEQIDKGLAHMEIVSGMSEVSEE